MSIRRYAHSAEAEIIYLDAPQQGELDEDNLRVIHHLGLSTRCLAANLFRQEGTTEHQVRRASHQSLFALSGESEATGYRPNLKSLLPFAKAQGFDTLLDAETLAPTSRLSLRDLEGTVDAMAITFHKMFGYPTGVGALIARRDFLAKLKRLNHLMLESEMGHGATSSAKDDTSLFERFEARFL
jgi:selenocysteine lyase/cysteine desulfurase